MKVHRLISTLLLMWLGVAMASGPQPTKAERELFDQAKKQADKGDAEAQLRLGFLYASGTGVTKDLRKAAKWHRKAAEQGLALAEYQLAQDYAEGEGVKPDDVEAARWFQKAADQGLVEGELQLGLCYLGGHGVRVNGAEAVRWFNRAAAQGMPRAEYELGKCYLEGSGVSRDIVEGIRRVQQAAEAGEPLAQNRLGLAYQQGEGLAKDPVRAYQWFALAAAQDDENVNEIRVNLAKAETLLSKEQVAEAQRLAREFKPNSKPAFSNTASQTNSVENVSASGGGPSIGFVNVKAEDDRSEVFVDGAFVGNPPARLKLSPGAHVVEVKQPGFKAYRREITVGSGSDLNLRAVLVKE